MQRQTCDNLDYTENQIDPRQIISLIWRHKWKLLSITLCVTLAAYIIGLQREPQFTASALVMVYPEERHVIDLKAVMAGATVDSGAMETQTEILRSRSLAVAIIEDLGLVYDTDLNGQRRGGGRPLDSVRDYLAQLSDHLPETFAVLAVSYTHLSPPS